MYGLFQQNSLPSTLHQGENNLENIFIYRNLACPWVCAFITVYEHWRFPSFVPFVPERMPVQLQLVAQVITQLWVLTFVWLSLNSRGTVRLAYLAVFAITVLAEYGAYYSVGRFSISEDYDMVLRLIDPRLYFNAAAIYTSFYLPVRDPNPGLCSLPVRITASTAPRPSGLSQEF